MIAIYLILATRILVFGLFSCAALIAGTHWAVQHGHLTPFGAFPRGVRQLGQPLLRPFERRLYRSGGSPTNAPYVFFWVALLGGLVLLGAVEWVISFVYSLSASASAGPRGLLAFTVNTIFSVLMIALFVRVIASWIAVSPYSRFMRAVHGLTDWLLEPLRKVIPPLGMIDVTPMVAYLMLMLARSFVMGLF